MTERKKESGTRESRARVHVAPPAFPPGRYREAQRAQALSGTPSQGAGGSLSDARAPDELADALESLARELRRRGRESLRSSRGAPALESELRRFVSRFLADPNGTE